MIQARAAGERSGHGLMVPGALAGPTPGADAQFPHDVRSGTESRTTGSADAAATIRRRVARSDHHSSRWAQPQPAQSLPAVPGDARATGLRVALGVRGPDERFWLSADYLLWAVQSNGVPPLAVADVPGTPRSAVGLPGTLGQQTLFGGSGTSTATLRLPGCASPAGCGSTASGAGGLKATSSSSELAATAERSPRSGTRPCPVRSSTPARECPTRSWSPSPGFIIRVGRAIDAHNASTPSTVARPCSCGGTTSVLRVLRRLRPLLGLLRVPARSARRLPALSAQ